MGLRSLLLTLATDLHYFLHWEQISFLNNCLRCLLLHFLLYEFSYAGSDHILTGKPYTIRSTFYQQTLINLHGNICPVLERPFLRALITDKWWPSTVISSLFCTDCFIFSYYTQLDSAIPVIYTWYFHKRWFIWSMIIDIETFL